MVIIILPTHGRSINEQKRIYKGLFSEKPTLLGGHIHIHKSEKNWQNHCTRKPAPSSIMIAIVGKYITRDFW